MVAALLVVVMAGSVNGQAADPVKAVIGEPVVAPMPAVEARDVLRHVTTGGGGIHTWLHAGPQVVSWIALLGGATLIATGAASDDGRYRKGAIITGSILAPIGLYGLLFRGESTPELVQDSTVGEYEAVMRSLFRSRTTERERARELIAQYPALHRRLRFAMTTLRSPDEETPEDTAFIEWYLALEE